MQQLRIRNLRTGVTLAEKCLFATSAYARMVGLLNHDSLPQGHGMLLKPCNQVHTFFMRFAIDAVFLSSDFEVLRVQKLKPWRISRIVFKARSVLELPVGVGDALKVGDRLEVQSC